MAKNIHGKSNDPIFIVYKLSKNLFHRKGITEKQFPILIEIRNQGLKTSRHFTDRLDVGFDVNLVPFFLHRDDLRLFQLFDMV